MLNLRSLVVVAIAVVSVGIASARPDLNAFLNKKATSTQQLVAQAKSDPEVMDRYMRHFSMSREQVLTFLGSLHPGKLETDSVFRIYSVPGDGHVKVHVSRVKQGTGMFYTTSGSPALIMLCGNPVIPGPDASLPLNPEAVDMSHPPTTFEVVSTPEDQLITDYIPPTIPEGTEFRGGDQLHIGSGVGAFPVALLGLGGFAFVNHGSHHNNNPVPEPASMIALTVGVVGVIRRRNKKK